MFADRVAGAAFRSDIEPALGLDPLRGFFLLVPAIAAVPALVFARGYLAGTPAARVVGPLTAAFLLAIARRRRARLRSSCWRGWGSVAPALLRETPARRWAL